jgi:cardiolipin synthase
MTLPNLLSGLRMLLIVPFVFFVTRRDFGVALIIFIIAALSDLFDGLIARKFNAKSQLGAVLDPMADKLLIFSSFLTLLIMKAIPFWLFLIVFIRDLQMLLGFYHLSSLKEVDKDHLPLPVGKMATALQLIITVLVMVKLHYEADINLTAVFILGGVVTLYASLKYFQRWRAALKTHHQN